MGMSCGICHHENEANEPICLECRHLYKERATNGTLPRALRPYSKKISMLSYADLHFNDKAFQGGKNDPKGAYKEYVEKITKRILYEVGASVSDSSLSDSSTNHVNTRNTHDQEVATYLKTFD